MFPSTYCSLGPYPSYNPNSSSSSSSSHSYPPFTYLTPDQNQNASSNNNNNNINTFLHDPTISVPYTQTSHHHHVPINPETLTNWAVADYAAMLKQDLSGSSSHYNFSNLLTKKPVKKPVKKDRHSKIHTSQGLRDRRVRLSIEIARKFFDLQDMLGFDKASNTLEWLFSKSKEAIEELTRIKNNIASGDEGVDDHSFSSSSSDEGEDEGRKLKRAPKESSKMKDSREKARARARERTSEMKIQDLKEKYPETEHNQQILHQLMPNDEESSKLVQRDDIFNFIEESIVIKRKLKKSSSHHDQQNTNLMPKEASFDHNESPMLTPNWDTNINNSNADATGRSNFSAISRMNLSSGLQIFGKSWEECNNSPNRY